MIVICFMETCYIVIMSLHSFPHSGKLNENQSSTIIPAKMLCDTVKIIAI